jgi:uncharacterized lipoprotein
VSFILILLIKVSVMNNQKFCFFVLCIWLTTLVGCSSLYGEKGIITDRNNEYQTVQTIPPLRVPASLTATQLTTDYIVPEITTQQKQALPMAPPGSLAERVSKNKSSIEVEKAQFKQHDIHSNTIAAPEVNPEVAPDAMNQSISNNTPAVSLNLPERSVSQNAGAKKEEVLIVPLPLIASWKLVGSAISQTEYRVILSNQKENTYYILDTFVTKGRVIKETPIYQVHLRVPTNRNIVAQKGQEITEVYLTDNEGGFVSRQVNKRILGDINDVLQGRTKSGLTHFMKFLSRSG